MCGCQRPFQYKDTEYQFPQNHLIRSILKGIFLITSWPRPWCSQLVSIDVFLGRCFLECSLMQNGSWGQTGLFAALQNCRCVGSCRTSFSTLSRRGHCAEVPGDSLLCRSDPFLFLGPELMGWGLVRVLLGWAPVCWELGKVVPTYSSNLNPRLRPLLPPDESCLLHHYLS